MTVVSGTAHLSMQSSMQVGDVPQPPTLLEAMLGTVGQDPSFLGATGYLDDVFTTRLASDTE